MGAGVPLRSRTCQNSPHDRRLKPTLQAEARATIVLFITWVGAGPWSLLAVAARLGNAIYGGGVRCWETPGRLRSVTRSAELRSVRCVLRDGQEASRRASRHMQAASLPRSS